MTLYLIQIIRFCEWFRDRILSGNAFEKIFFSMLFGIIAVFLLAPYVVLYETVSLITQLIRERNAFKPARS